jgi:hypothetical protein
MVSPFLHPIGALDPRKWRFVEKALAPIERAASLDSKFLEGKRT